MGCRSKGSSSIPAGCRRVRGPAATRPYSQARAGRNRKPSCSTSPFRAPLTRGPLDHLGYRKEVGLYDNDSQIKEVHYQEVESDQANYRVTLRPLKRLARP
jgi:hypothetical protein